MAQTAAGVTVQTPHGAALPAAAPAATAFTLSATLGVPPQRIYSHLSNPLNLLGLQPLLVAVEDVQSQTAAAPAASGSAAKPLEVQFVAVEAFHFWPGGPAWHNRISVRQQLLGRKMAQPAADGQPQQAAGRQLEQANHAVAPTSGSHPLRMRYLVTSPPLGMVRLEVLWTFEPACQAVAAAASKPEQQQQRRQQAEDDRTDGNRGCGKGFGDTSCDGDGNVGSSSGSGGTRVQLDVLVQAPWLLRGVVMSQAQQAQQALLANLKQRLESTGGSNT